jgi:hypothetical protein
VTPLFRSEAHRLGLVGRNTLWCFFGNGKVYDIFRIDCRRIKIPEKIVAAALVAAPFGSQAKISRSFQ